jgi:16S rRNA (uracil1498-N3)-methyltransferase
VYARTALAPGSRVELDDEESHHVARVLRLRSGDELAVFDGNGTECLATIETLSRDRVTLTVGALRTGAPDPPIAVRLFQALVRPERIEWVLQKGTEIGIASVRLVPAERSEAPAPSPSRLDRYRRVVMEACKQSGRRRLPEVEEGSMESPPVDALGILLDTSASARPLGELLEHPRRPEVWIAIGPEGGFTDGELAAWEAAGWARASLGPRTLRTETAGAIATALVLHRWGDLG